MLVSRLVSDFSIGDILSKHQIKGNHTKTDIKRKYLSIKMELVSRNFEFQSSVVSSGNRYERYKIAYCFDQKQTCFATSPFRCFAACRAHAALGAKKSRHACQRRSLSNLFKNVPTQKPST